MKRTFSYNKSGNEVVDSLVDTFYTLTQKYIEGKSDTEEYKEANTAFTDNFMRYCVESIPNATYSSLEMIKNPMIHNNIFFQQTFDTVLAQAITPVVPTVASEGYSQLYDVTQVGFGVA